ncbi:hypothetical protein O181_013497 [Austropuccinia psidii MF-1]|uniref:Retrovirus-related Pol polyprotein from transposon TNT 1-94-like beta-barrel domain-containing protein n=1 Tax=Austropuccinia psidii MF-1 TaxID=1389203 RepID=A0A9Q3BYF3_9BASI|nr:hypothetical protein [Austropuccinia psidii MF-1]
MEHCLCRKCSTHIWIDSSGTTQKGRLLSSRNRCKHLCHDYSQSTTPPIDQQYKESSESLMSLTDGSEDEDSSDNHSNELALEVQNKLTFIVSVFICWLHLICSYSLETCCIVNQFIMVIIAVAQQNNSQDNQFPKDVRIMSKNLCIQPQLKQLICCKTCYSLYKGANTPLYCTYQPFSKTPICNTPLFQVKTPLSALQTQGLSLSSSSRYRSHNPSTIHYPRAIYYTQDILEWVEWLLGLPTIEIEITKWKNKLATLPHVNDVQQEQAWKKLQWTKHNGNESSRICLTFSLFIDWFNPRGNKQAGKQESMGLILLTCLNLPPKLRHKPAYSLVFGIIPGPNSPNTVTISNILKHLVAQLLELKDGVHIPTFLYPDGKYIYLQLLPLIGDLVAVHKASGVASHSANHFCPWCTAQLPDLQLMRQGEMRNGLDILKAAKDWKYLKTLSEQNEFRKKTGVRWSELNNLPYWNPNMHLALGILHNWLEGVLAEHLRINLLISNMSNPTDSSISLTEIKNLEKLSTSNFVTWQRGIVSSLGMRNLKGILYEDSSTLKTDPIKLKQREMVYYFIVGHLDDENYDKFVSEDENDPVTLWKNIKDYYASSSAENIASNFGKLFSIKFPSSSSSLSESISSFRSTLKLLRTLSPTLFTGDIMPQVLAFYVLRMLPETCRHVSTAVFHSIKVSTKIPTVEEVFKEVELDIIRRSGTEDDNNVALKREAYHKRRNNQLDPGTGIALAACNSSISLSDQPILDSGCSNTIAPTNRGFLNTTHSKETLLAANGNSMEVVSEGTLCLKTSIGSLLIHKALVVPSVPCTLVSLGPYLNNGATLKGYKGGADLLDKHGKLILTTRIVNNVLFIDTASPNLACSAISGDPLTIHRRLGNPSV